MSGAWIDLYWLPLGAGGHCVRWNGRVYERLAAIAHRRRPRDLYHAALLIRSDFTTYAVEMGPVWNVAARDRGVVCEGPVGARMLGRFRAFRYEVRCWPGGSIPDLKEAVGGAHRLTDDPAQVAAVLSLLPQVPPLTWGRDELGAGDMWNSNSLVSWALAGTGHDMKAIKPPPKGRAPGWRAGLCLADGAAPLTANGCNARGRQGGRRTGSRLIWRRKSVPRPGGILASRTSGARAVAELERPRRWPSTGLTDRSRHDGRDMKVRDARALARAKCRTTPR